MKLRIQDSSVRFRITLKELDVLRTQGSLGCEACVPAGEGAAVFQYEVRHVPDLSESALHVEPFLFRLTLSDTDFQALADPANEGAYIRREWSDATGERRRFIVFIEKDRPGSTCIKQEAWIYEIDYASRSAETRPIPGRPQRSA